MIELKFHQQNLVNLEYSLTREFISANRAGSYMSTTITCCNTRKYHGLMVCPISDSSSDRYVLLSSLDETVIQHDRSFNLALHKYPDNYEPKGHKYITSFEYSPTPAITYRVGGVELRKEMLWLHDVDRLMIKYTLLEATSPTRLQLRPFLAYRSIDSLSHANMEASGHSTPTDGGVSVKPYANMPALYMQIDSPNEFIPAPDWYYDFEYSKEAERGYECREDLLTPGIFEFPIAKGESVIISCSLEKVNPELLKEEYATELARRSDKNNFKRCLQHSARQFFVGRNNREELIAGYPWYGMRGRDALMALPGLALTQGHREKYIGKMMEVLDNLIAERKEGLFPTYHGDYSCSDTSLYFFYDMYELERYIGKEQIWERYGQVMKEILDAYVNDTLSRGVVMHDNGLIWADGNGKPLTWMDARTSDGVAVTERKGYQVEVNAMWYSAVCYLLDMGRLFCDREVIDKWDGLPERIRESFVSTFMLKEGYLADYVNDTEVSKAIRPNQLFACGLPYPLLDDTQIISILNTVDRYLVTPKGLRTLSPDHSDYKGLYEGDENARSQSTHQGSVRPWMLVPYIAAKLKVHGVDYLEKVDEMLDAMREELTEYCVGSIAEIYEGNPPFRARGAISFAVNVAAILKLTEMFEQMRESSER